MPAPSLEVFRPDVARLPVVFVNAYLVGEPGGPWALVDTGLPGSAALTRAAARARFGGRPPEAILLTHGHFDHAGAALALARAYDVPVYAHPMELPYLTGRSDYAPPDPTIPGAISALSRVFPHTGRDLGAHVHALPEDGTVPGMPGWTWLHTPGHTPGHVSFWRESDRTLLAGDAVVTVDLDSWAALATMPRQFDRPPAPLTPDWDAALKSVAALAALAPEAVGAGHGQAVTRGTANALHTFAAHALPPAVGRYTHAPALADEHGLLSLPPSVPDPFPLKVAAGAALGLLVAALRRRR
ncbi:MAG TPA: MBL fold metallo-hydrolase [Rubricoccaceae bacterium]|jgi:glyoxylase-like metal-dependent hydrolase (beta-lactamase superfamily II)